MGLVKCPDCGKKISDIAESCPGCGRPRARVATPTTTEDTIAQIVKSANESESRSPLRNPKGCILMFLVGALITFGVKQFSSPSMDEVIRDLQKTMPKQIDELTEATAVTLIGKTIQFDQRLVKVDINATDKIKAVEYLNTTMRKATVKQLCGQTATKKALQKGYSYRYNWFDKNRTPVAVVDISSKDCEN